MRSSEMEQSLQREPNENCYYVRLRGLPWSATKQDVVDFFKSVKLCEGNTAVLFTIAQSGRRSGEALVAVQDREDFEKALACNRNYIGKRWVEVVPATYEEFIDVLAKMAPTDNEFVVRMRGLPYAATAKDIRQFFEGIEIGSDAVMVVTDDQGRCGGDAYVEFGDATSTQTALLRHRNKMGSRFIEVFRSTKGEMIYVGTAKATPLMSINTRQRNVEPGMGGIKRTLQFHDKGLNRGRYDGDSPEYEISSKYSFEKFIYIRGLPFNCTENDIVDFFTPIQVISLSMLCDETGNFTGQADVYFETDSDAIRAMNENRGCMGRRNLDLLLKNRKVFVLGRINPNSEPLDNFEKQRYPSQNSYQRWDSSYDNIGGVYDPPMRVSKISNLSQSEYNRPQYDNSSFKDESEAYPSRYYKEPPNPRPTGRSSIMPYIYDNSLSNAKGPADISTSRPPIYNDDKTSKLKPFNNFFSYY